jgi:hypothetical protein
VSVWSGAAETKIDSYLTRKLPHMKSRNNWFYSSVKILFEEKIGRRDLQDKFHRGNKRLDFFASDLRAVLIPIHVDK